MRFDKKSQLGFSVVKVRSGEDYLYLMRKNDRWKDYNFIGGHLEEVDHGNFERTARRELREEVPGIRGLDFDLVPLTPLLKVGPVYSKSANVVVLYQIAFFSVVLRQYPNFIYEIPHRSRNRLIGEDLMQSSTKNITAFAKLLAGMFDRGLKDLPLSWAEDLPSLKSVGLLHSNQLELDL